MDIPGLYYFNPSSWSQVNKPLKQACAEAIQKVAGDCVYDCEMRDLAAVERVPLLVECLMHHHDGVVNQTLAALEPKRRWLTNSYVDARSQVSVFDLAVDLTLALGRAEATEGKVPPPAIQSLARKLARMKAPAGRDQLVKCAEDVLKYYRVYLDVQMLRERYGMEKTVDYIDRKMRLVDTVQSECLRLLESWESHSDLAALVCGQPVDPRIPPIQLRRALRDHNMPTAWLMRFDQHYEHIRKSLAERAGAPLSDKVKLKPPISSKRRDTILFEEPAIAEVLQTLAFLRSHREDYSDNIELLATLKNVRIVDDDGEQEIQTPPEGEASPEQDDEVDEEDVSTDDDGEWADASEEGLVGGEQDHSPPIFSAEEPDELDNKQAPAEIPQWPASDFLLSELTSQCLDNFTETLRVGVMLRLAQRVADLNQRTAILEALCSWYQEDGVFERLEIKKPSWKALTDKALATHTPNPPQGSGISVADFRIRLEQAMKQFEDCARQCLAKLGKRPQD